MRARYGDSSARWISEHMPSTLVSGPAGAGKSAIARQIVADAERTSVVLDFQEIFALLLGITRNPDYGALS